MNYYKTLLPETEASIVKAFYKMSTIHELTNEPLFSEEGRTSARLTSDPTQRCAAALNVQKRTDWSILPKPKRLYDKCLDFGTISVPWL